jgi:hypothetical protein
LEAAVFDLLSVTSKPFATTSTYAPPSFFPALCSLAFRSRPLCHVRISALLTSIQRELTAESYRQNQPVLFFVRNATFGFDIILKARLNGRQVVIFGIRFIIRSEQIPVEIASKRDFIRGDSSREQERKVR